MPYWLSLLADLLVRAGAAATRRGATLDAADRRRACPRDDVWWLPEVMRMRAAHDDRDAARRAAARRRRLAAEHGSVALLRRCEHDLGRPASPVRRRSPAVLTRANAGRTLRERRAS